MKPVFLLPQLWQKHITLEVKIEQSDKTLLKEMQKVHGVMASRALSSVFLLLCSDVKNPGEIARRMGRSKYAASLDISKLKQCGLVILSARSSHDLRQRNYEISQKKLLEVFKRDYSFELELYENQLLSEAAGEVQGSMNKVELAILGNGRLGMVREVTLDKPPVRLVDVRKIHQRIEALYLEFIELFKTYLKERRFSTILEYFLGFYRELSLNHSKLPPDSELGQFFDFVDISITKIKPIEELWKLANPSSDARSKIPTQGKDPKFESVKLFTEAGKMDSSGRYILNANSRAYLNPGVNVKIYPSYTFMD